MWVFSPFDARHLSRALSDTKVTKSQLDHYEIGLIKVNGNSKCGNMYCTCRHRNLLTGHQHRLVNRTSDPSIARLPSKLATR
jgi:hypothetical protein